MKKIFLFFYNFIEDVWHLKKIIFFFSKIRIKDPIYIDIGAHKGKFVQNFIKIYKRGKFYITEPNSSIYTYLKKKFRSNQIKIFDYAIGNFNEKKKMQINSVDLTNTLSKINKNSKYFKFKNFILSLKKNISNKSLTKIVNVITLDKFCKINKIKYIDILKVDVEGSEFEVLKGAKKIIKKTNFVIIEIQNNKMYRNYSKYKIDLFLKKNNFKIIKTFKFPLIGFEDRVYKKII